MQFLWICDGKYDKLKMVVTWWDFPRVPWWRDGLIRLLKLQAFPNREMIAPSWFRTVSFVSFFPSFEAVWWFQTDLELLGNGSKRTPMKPKKPSVENTVASYAVGKRRSTFLVPGDIYSDCDCNIRLGNLYSAHSRYFRRWNGDNSSWNLVSAHTRYRHPTNCLHGNFRLQGRKFTSLGTRCRAEQWPFSSSFRDSVGLVFPSILERHVWYV
jgi:hypothetical protein